MKIGIAGYGFVGMAHDWILKDYHDIIISDPAKGHYGDLRHADAIIVCVSTPQREDGSCNVNNVYEVIESSPDVPILIKSTLNVEGWKAIVNAFPDRSLTFSPEFLRAAHWEKDIVENKHWYLGGTSTQFWADILLNVLGPISITIKDPADLVAAKAFRNSFLALKVSFFNQIYDYCKAHDLNYDAVADVISADDRIGDSHTTITQQRGYGGHCFPKDVRATIKSGQAYNARLTLLEEADAYNSTIRND